MKEEKSAFDRDTSLALKGLAIIMLLFHHLFRVPDCYKEFIISFFPFAEHQINNLAEACRICVPIFAFISGYGLFVNYDLKCSNNSATNWCIRRYVRTMSGYWFVWMLTAILFQIINGRTLNILFESGRWNGVAYGLIDFLGLARLFDTPTLCYTWWYMSATFTFIIITPIIYLFRKNLVLVLLVFIMFPRIILGKSGEVLYLGSVAIYSHIIPFVLGSIFASHRLFDSWITFGRKNKLTTAYKILAEFWLIIIGYKFFHSISRYKLWEYHFGLYPMLIMMFAVEFILTIPHIRRLLCFLGSNSMNMFLSHTLLQLYYPKLFYSKKHFAVVTLFFLGLSLLLSFAINWLKKVTKYNDAISRMNSKIVQKEATNN